jgi:hypothetical protein
MIPNWIETQAVKSAKVEEEYENFRRNENDLRMQQVNVNERLKPTWTSASSSSTIPPTQWSTTLSPKVNLPHTIDLSALCGANLKT